MSDLFGLIGAGDLEVAWDLCEERGWCLPVDESVEGGYLARLHGAQGSCSMSWPRWYISFATTGTRYGYRTMMPWSRHHRWYGAHRNRQPDWGNRWPLNATVTTPSLTLEDDEVTLPW